MRRTTANEWRTKEALAIIEGMCHNGLTDEDIAKNIGISRKTLYNWRQKYSEIEEAMKHGKDIADIIVENALYRRATGHSLKTVTVDEVLDEDGKPTGNKQRRTVIKEISPDTSAIIWWLKNRKGEQWRDKPTEIVEEYEDDGLIAALKDCADKLFVYGDDSWMLPVDED